MRIGNQMRFEGFGEHPIGGCGCIECLEKIKKYGAEKQPEPTTGKQEVMPMAMRVFEQRYNKGLDRYKTPLMTHNGRSATLDALEEACDLVMYLTQKALEEGVI